MKDYTNADFANEMHDFYLFALGSFDVTNHTFLITTSHRHSVDFLPLIPLRYRNKVRLDDMALSEVKQLERRIAHTLG